MEQNELKDIISSKEDGFGHYLKSIREEKNLSIKEISKELHLDERIIMALESEDYTQLPEPAFVFGYIRIYAKLLHVQAEPMIEYYKKDVGLENLEPDLNISKERRIRKSSQNFKIVMPVLMFLFFALLVLGGWKLWLYVSENYINVEHSAASEELLINPSETNSNSNEVNDNNIDGSDRLLLPVIDETKDIDAKKVNEADSNASDNSLYNKTASETEARLNEGGTTALEESISTVDASLSKLNSQLTEILPDNDLQTAGISTEAENVELSANAGDSLHVEDSVNVEDSQNTDAEIVSTASGSVNQLLLEFAADSWIKIKDSANKTLAFGVKKSGSSLSLEGQRPYTMIVGNAESVKVSLGGKAFDHSSYINENSVARFTIK